MKALAAKMVLIMSDISHLDKDAKNAFHKYEYTSDNMVYNAVRKSMITHNVAVFTKMPIVEQIAGVTSTNKQNWHTLAQFEFELVDADSGESMVCAWYGEADDQNDKGVNKCATAALKYFLLKTFIIPTGDDPDATVIPDATPPVQDRRFRDDPPPAKRTKTPAPVLEEYFDRDPVQESGFDLDADYSPVNDARKFTSTVITDVKQYMRESGMVADDFHAAGRILKSVQESAPERAEWKWGQVYKAGLITADVWQMVVKHTADKAKS